MLTSHDNTFDKLGPTIYTTSRIAAIQTSTYPQR